VFNENQSDTVIVGGREMPLNFPCLAAEVYNSWQRFNHAVDAARAAGLYVDLKSDDKATPYYLPKNYKLETRWSWFQSGEPPSDCEEED
jgi:hypothetical protein